MTVRFRKYLARAFIGLVIALITGIGIVAMSNAAIALSHDSSLLSTWSIISIDEVFIASAAMLLLAICGVRAKIPWIVALCLTVGFWSYYVFVITRPYEGGGANIGLGIVMLFSPLPIAAGSLVSLSLLSNRQGAEETADGS